MPLTTAPPPRPACPSFSRFIGLARCGLKPKLAAAPIGCSADAPLTHHEILQLATPFTRSGLKLDMGDSDRRQRRLVFRGLQRSLTPPSEAAAFPQNVQQTLQLENPRTGHFRLTRILYGGGGLHATLQASGDRPGDLLRAVQAVPPWRHFEVGRGYCIARSGCVDPGGGFRLTSGMLHTDALVMTVTLSSPEPWVVSSATVAIQTLHAVDALPADLLAVLGWDWSLLRSSADGWQGSVRLRGGPGGGDMELKLRTAAAHLARTLTEPPTRFDERQRPARLRALLRHAIPVLTCVLVGVLALFADALRDARESPLTLTMMCVPPALLLLYMLLSEQPRLEWPMWPRRLTSNAWTRLDEAT
jgi:hypothetical protein